MVRENEIVEVKVSIENTGTESNTFEIGMTMRHIATNRDFDLPLQSEFEGPGSSPGSETFKWQVPGNAPKGDYTIITAVWEGENNGVPFNRLDDRVLSRAFNVQ